MGFVRAAPTYRLTFEDPSLAGLVVRVRSVSTGRLLTLTRAAGLLIPAFRSNGHPADVVPSAEDLAAMDLLFESFADALASWNLEDCPDPGGECAGPGCGYTHVPVPADLDGVKAQDVPLTLLLVQEWMKAAGGVPDPLGGGSTPGATDGEQEMGIPMEPLTAAGLPS